MFPSKCPREIYVKENREWYYPMGSTPRECSICEECKMNLSSTFEPLGLLRTLSSVYGEGFNCDASNQLWRDGLSVSIQHAFTNKKHPIAPVTTVQHRLDGMAHFCVPTSTPYKIHIKNWRYLTDTTVHFSIEECRVGSELVKINDGERIAYNGETTIDGKKTGSTGGFMFISLSDKERAEGKTLPGYNTSNIIYLTLKIWKRHPAPKLRPEPVYPFGGLGLGSYRSFSFGAPEMNEEPASGAGLAIVEKSQSYTGGATVYDDRKIEHVKTVATKDRYEEISTVRFTIQLICDASDTEKQRKNAHQVQKQLQEKLRVAEIDYDIAEKRLRDVLQEVASKQATMLTARADLKRHQEQYGSAYVTDGLINFQ